MRYEKTLGDDMLLLPILRTTKKFYITVAILVFFILVGLFAWTLYFL